MQLDYTPSGQKLEELVIVGLRSLEVQEMRHL